MLFRSRPRPFLLAQKSSWWDPLEFSRKFSKGLRFTVFLLRRHVEVFRGLWPNRWLCGPRCFHRFFNSFLFQFRGRFQLSRPHTEVFGERLRQALPQLNVPLFFLILVRVIVDVLCNLSEISGPEPGTFK